MSAVPYPTSFAILDYDIKAHKYLENGTLPDYPDPAPPEDLGTALTQDDIDFIKTLRKEIAERFNPPIT
jgi:hypothetical protein